MSGVPTPRPDVARTSWTWYAAVVSMFAAIVAPYLLCPWFDEMEVRYTFIIAAVVLFIAYCLVDGAKSPGRTKRTRLTRNDT